MSESDSSSPPFFETKYRAAADADPWKFATAAYELQRYDTIMHALAGRRYARPLSQDVPLGF